MTRSALCARLLRAGVAGLSSRTGRAIILYALSFGFAGLTPFALLPLLTHRLSPAEFGQATSWIVLAGLIASICGLTTPALLSVRFFKVSHEDLQKLTSSALTVVVGAHTILVLYLLMGPDPFARFTHLSKYYSIAATVLGMVISINLVGLGLMQITSRAGLYLALRVLQSAIEIGGCIFLLWLLAGTPDVRIFSYAAAVAVSALCGVAFIASQGLLKRMPKGAGVRDVVRFGAPIVPHVLAGQLLSNLDRMMVSYVLGVDQLGIFMVASQLGMALGLVIEPLNRALAPWLFEHLSRTDSAINAKIVRGTYLIFGGLLVIAFLSAATFAVLFDLIFTPDYSEAKSIVLPIAIGMAFQGMYYGVVNYVYFAEATARLSLVTTIIVSLSVVSSYLLVSTWGLAGAGISFMLTNAVFFFAVWHLSRKVVKMPWFRSESSTA